MVHHSYLVLFSTLCCPLDAGSHLWENAVGELELLSGQKLPNRKWRKPCISTFKRTQQNISQRWSHVRLYGPLHEYHLPVLDDREWTVQSCAVSQKTLPNHHLMTYLNKNRCPDIERLCLFPTLILFSTLPLFPTAMQRKSHLCIPFLGIARPQSQSPHSFVCEQFYIPG